MAGAYPRLLKCPVCDTVVEVLAPCGLDLVCCGPEMIPLREKVCRRAEPHALVVERWGDQVRVRVGRVPHPMDEDHHVAWIEATSGGQCCRQFLRPGQAPEAVFSIPAGDLVARAYCNVHGLWQSAPAWVRDKKRYAEAGVAAAAEG